MFSCYSNWCLKCLPLYSRQFNCTCYECTINSTCIQIKGLKYKVIDLTSLQMHISRHTWLTYKINVFTNTYFRLSGWLLFNAKGAIFLLFHGKNKLHSMGLWWCPFCIRPTLLVDFYSTSSMKQQSAGDTLLYSDTLSWFRDQQSLLFLLNAVCLAEK